MWKLLAVLVLVGCAGDDQHELGACDPAWAATAPSVSLQRCEHACEAPPMLDGPRCLTTSCASGDGRTCEQLPCIETFNADGQPGCCMLGGSSSERIMQFYACE